MAETPIATYDFAGTGALSGDWTQCNPRQGGGVLERNSDEGASDAAGEGGALWTGDTFDNDQYSEVEFQVGGSYTAFIGVYVRGSGTGATFDGYAFHTDGVTGTPNHSQVTRLASGEIADTIEDFSMDAEAGDVMKITIEGTTLRVFLNDVEQGSSPYTGESDIASGYPGCGVLGLAGRCDNWEGGDITSGGSSVPVIMQQMHSRMIEQAVRAKKWYERKSGLLVPDREIFPVPVSVTR